MPRTKQTTKTTKSKEKTSTKFGSSYVYKAPNVQFTDMVHKSAFDMKLNEELSASSQVVLNDDNEISIEADQFIEETSQNATNAHSKPMGNIFEAILVDADVANLAKVVAKMNGQFEKNIAKLNDQVALIEDRTREIQVMSEQQGYSRENSKVKEKNRRILQQKELIELKDINEKGDTIIAETPFKDDKRYEALSFNESLKDPISSNVTLAENQVNLNKDAILSPDTITLYQVNINNPNNKLSSISEMIGERNEQNIVSMIKYESSEDTSQPAEEQPILKNETQALREQISQDVKTVEHDTKEDNLSTKSKWTRESNEVYLNKKFSHPPSTSVTAIRRKMSADRTQRRPNSGRLILRGSTSRPNSRKLTSRSSTSRPNSRRLTSRRNNSGFIQGYSFAQIVLCSVLLSAIISMAIGCFFQCSQRKMIAQMENRRNTIHRNKMISFHNTLDCLNQTTNEDDFLELYLNKKILDDLKVLAETLERKKSNMNIVDKVKGMLNRNENEDTGKGDACEKRNLHASCENDG